MNKAAFSIGEVIKHKLFDYHGVIYDVDPCFMESEEWYQSVAKTCPPKDKPWYRVLVDGHDAETYVAERNLEHCAEKQIEHPKMDLYFKNYEQGCYTLRALKT